MKANQINMEVSSIAPALLALYACYQGARSVFFRLHRLLPSTRHEPSMRVAKVGRRATP